MPTGDAAQWPAQPKADAVGQRGPSLRDNGTGGSDTPRSTTGPQGSLSGSLTASEGGRSPDSMRPAPGQRPGPGQQGPQRYPQQNHQQSAPQQWHQQPPQQQWSPQGPPGPASRPQPPAANRPAGDWASQDRPSHQQAVEGPPRILSGTISSTAGSGSMTQNEPAATTGDQETVSLTRPPSAFSGELSPRSSGTVFESAAPQPSAADREPPQDPPSAPEAAKPPRKRRGPLIGALAAVVVVALGAAAVFTIEPVGRIFGIGPATEPTEPAPDPIDPDFALSPVDHASAGPSEAGLSSALQPSVTAAEIGTLRAVIVDPGTGQPLWGNEADVPATPASTTKILTSAAALLTFPADHTFATTVIAGPTPGSVILVGGGDPSLTATPDGTDTLYSSNPARMSELAAQVRENAGDLTITEVLVDASRYTGQPIADGWDAGDAPSSYGGYIEPLMLDGGRSDPLNDLSRRVDDPALEAGHALAAELGVTNVSAVDEAGSPVDGAVLGEVRSLPLVDLIEAMMLLSDNVAAEMLAREVAIERGAEPSFEGAAASVIGVLGENGFDISQLELSDASGLSNQNLITANLLGDVLSVAAHPADGSDTAISQQLRPMLTGLAVAGASGKLTDRYPAGSSAGRGWVQAKTGSLTAVNGLAGVVTDRDGKLMVFALLSSGTPATMARPALDEVTSALRECGCR